MAKLYWRVKKDGKWTWTPLVIRTDFDKQLVARWATLVEDVEAIK